MRFSGVKRNLSVSIHLNDSAHTPLRLHLNQLNQ